MHYLPNFGRWTLSRYLVVVIAGCFVVTGGVLWLGSSETGGVLVQDALLAGFLFIAVVLGNHLVGVTYLKSIQYTKSVLEDDEILE